MKYKILVADDEPATVKLITDTLDSLGVDVVSSTDSQQVAEHLKRQRFDGVFLDVRMPGLNGIELTKQTRASSVNAQIPIVILTGQNDGDTMHEAFRAGATLFSASPSIGTISEAYMAPCADPCSWSAVTMPECPFKPESNAPGAPLENGLPAPIVKVFPRMGCRLFQSGV